MMTERKNMKLRTNVDDLYSELWHKPSQWMPCFEELSSRAKNILSLYDINTPQELALLSERQVRKFRNCGRKTISELRVFLQERGLDFVDPIDSKIKALEREVQSLRKELAQANLRIKELEARYQT